MHTGTPTVHGRSQATAHPFDQSAAASKRPSTASTSSVDSVASTPLHTPASMDSGFSTPGSTGTSSPGSPAGTPGTVTPGPLGASPELHRLAQPGVRRSLAAGQPIADRQGEGKHSTASHQVAVRIWAPPGYADRLQPAGRPGGDDDKASALVARLHRQRSAPRPNFRQRHPVLTVTGNAVVRDTLGQGTGRMVYLLVFPLLASAMFNEDPDRQETRRIVLAVVGGVFALLMAAWAGLRTAQKVTALAHHRSVQACRESHLPLTGVIPPLATALGMALSGGMFGLRGLALTTANSVARIFQFYGRDSAGQAWVSRTQYRPDGWFPGYGLVVMTDRGPLATVDPEAAHRFKYQRLNMATLLYLGTCFITYGLVPRLQRELFTRDPQDVSLEAFFGANLGAALASVGLEMADAATGVLAFPIMAWWHGYHLALDTGQGAFDLPAAILHNGHARLAFNAMHEVVSPLIERQPHPAMAVILRTVAQTITEPRGFVAVNGRNLLLQWSREEEAARAAARAEDSDAGP